ncbi:MAG: hypothetical protein JHD16_07560 [Solirubrobacteraceae bacterium]|nr:hypothetical protein [Solirubrobacteraceae bacterium]
MLRPAVLARTALFAALVGVTAPSTALAASVSVKGKCYVAYPPNSEQASYGEPIPVEVEELTPGRQVKLTLEVKGTLTSSSPMLTADRRGNLVTDLTNWTTGMGNGPTKASDARMVVRDFWLGTELGSASLQVANVAALIDGDLMLNSVKRRWYISGLSEISKRNGYYAHYYLPSGKKVGRQYLGTTQDRCGFLRAKRYTFPGGKNEFPDKFDIRIQASPTFTSDEPFVEYRFYKVIMGA